MIVADTGVLFAAADRSDAHHERCSQFLDNTDAALRVPTPVVIETAWLVSFGIALLVFRDAVCD